MGLLSLLRSLYKSREKELRILLLGLDNAGKTTILKTMASESDVELVKPTLGFNVKAVRSQGFKLNVWDIGGQKKIRPYWKHYFEDTDVLIFVVDSTDDARMDESAEELGNLLAEEKLAGVPLLIYANKQDLDLAQTEDALTGSLQLASITDRHWRIQLCSAINNEGIEEGVHWMNTHIGKSK